MIAITYITETVNWTTIGNIAVALWFVLLLTFAALITMRKRNQNKNYENEQTDT